MSRPKVVESFRFVIVTERPDSRACARSYRGRAIHNRYVNGAIRFAIAPYFALDEGPQGAWPLADGLILEGRERLKV